MPPRSITSDIYILENASGIREKIGIYAEDRELIKEIEIGHGHTNRPKSGKKERLIRGVAHIHHTKGGRGNNVRYLTKKEQKKYGNLVVKIGGKLSV